MYRTILKALCEHQYRRVEEHYPNVDPVVTVRCHDCGKVLLNADEYYIARELILDGEAEDE